MCAGGAGKQGRKKGKRAGGGGGGTQTHYEGRGLIAVKHVKLGVDLSVLVAAPDRMHLVDSDVGLDASRMQTAIKVVDECGHALNVERYALMILRSVSRDCMTGDTTGPDEHAFFFTCCSHHPSYLNQLQPLQ